MNSATCKTACSAVPFCTLSHSRKISSPPLQLPELRLTLQIFSSAVFGAPGRQKKQRHFGCDHYDTRCSVFICNNGTGYPLNLIINVSAEPYYVLMRCPLTVVIDGLRYHRIQLKPLARRQSERGLEAKANWIEVKLLLPHLRLRNCSQHTAGKGWSTQSGNIAVWCCILSYAGYQYLNEVKGERSKKHFVW